MATVFDRAGMSTATTGTGTLTLGSALGNVSPNLAAFMSFAAAGVGNAQQVPYLILDSNNAWEVGTGTYTASGTTLSRNVLWSSNANAAISLSGNAQVFITEIAEDINQAGYGGFRNKFRNPGVDVDQRATNAGAMTVTTAGAYVTDGHIVVPTGASVTAQQVTRSTIAAQSANALKIVGNTSVTDVQVKLRIESTIAAPLAGQTVTVQCKLRNDTGGAFTPTLSAGSVAVDSFPAFNGLPRTGDVNAASLQSCANGATTQLAYTFAAGASDNMGLEVTFDLGNNFSSNAKSVQLTDFDIRVTPGVTTGLNSNPPPPELRPIASEVVFCQRYFVSLNPTGISAFNYGAGGFNTGTDTWTIVTFPGPGLRAAGGTVTFTAAGTFILEYFSITPSAINTRGAVTPYNLIAECTCAGGTTNAALLLRDNAAGTSNITVSAEL